MSKRRVVITGIGIVSPVGNDLATSWKNIVAGVSGIDLITHFDATNLATKIAGEVKGFSTDGFVDAREARRMDRFIQLGMVAGVQAVRDSGIEDCNIDKERVGLIIGSGIGGLPSIEENSITLKEKGPRRISPFFIPGALGNMIAGQLSILYGYKGVNYGVVSACASSNHCMGDAARYIEYGDCDIMLAGGAEASICAVGMAGFNVLKALSTRNDDPKTASRPWDKDRDGFVMGEGSAVFVLEEYEHAKKRGAKIYAEIVGYGATSDANHITAPTVDGPARSMRMALKNAGINPEQIGYINAHGTSTPLGDLNETNAVKEVFGEHAYKLSVSSTKSMTGHLLGAASAIEAVFTVKAIQDGIIPPTINIFEQDPECDLDYTANVAKERSLEYGMSNSFGFGGTNSTVIFKKV
ncbi:beta-ketoacyl-ACP synthase II [Aquella oligotrophica]|uniref:3-oxoacyl-[acyl-carrier-protein] synthase 2 n=1 Tax=Aquella oligotrophica TaxID=2067065 RepID=A0A2I7N975_9NEIS|nr:beta-ketoacyl-ACP synthase II [Aquella oligotrophica]AUR53006.1 beta-ketoacyl-[acyl-carrier-protein] synthase II [Aquella oligotrophica]